MSQTAQGKQTAPPQLNLSRRSSKNSNNSKGSLERSQSNRQNQKFSPGNYKLIKAEIAKDSKLKNDPKYIKLVEQIQRQQSRLKNLKSKTRSHSPSKEYRDSKVVNKNSQWSNIPSREDLHSPLKVKPSQVKYININDTGNFNKSNNGIFQTPSARSDKSNDPEREEAQYIRTNENPLMTFDNQNQNQNREMDPLDIQLLQRASSRGTEDANPTQRTSKAIDEQYFTRHDGGLVSSMEQSDCEDGSKIEKYSKVHKDLKFSGSLPSKVQQPSIINNKQENARDILNQHSITKVDTFGYNQNTNDRANENVQAALENSYQSKTNLLASFQQVIKSQRTHRSNNSRVLSSRSVGPLANDFDIRSNVGLADLDGLLRDMTSCVNDLKNKDAAPKPRSQPPMKISSILKNRNQRSFQDLDQPNRGSLSKSKYSREEVLSQKNSLQNLRPLRFKLDSQRSESEEKAQPTATNARNQYSKHNQGLFTTLGKQFTDEKVKIETPDYRRTNEFQVLAHQDSHSKAFQKFNVGAKNISQEPRHSSIRSEHSKYPTNPINKLQSTMEDQEKLVSKYYRDRQDARTRQSNSPTPKVRDIVKQNFDRKYEGNVFKEDRLPQSIPEAIFQKKQAREEVHHTFRANNQSDSGKRHAGQESVDNLDKYLQMDANQSSAARDPREEESFTYEPIKYKLIEKHENPHSLKSSSQLKQIDQSNKQWMNEKIYLMDQRLRDQGFQIQLKDQVITKLESRIQKDQGIMSKLEYQAKQAGQQADDSLAKLTMAEGHQQRNGDQYNQLRAENLELERQKEEREEVHLREMTNMESRYQETIKMLKQQNESMKAGTDENRALMAQGSEQMLSEQLKEMTSVLEEFDLKYSRKEKQLLVARNQNSQLKEAFDQLKVMQTKVTDQLSIRNEEYQQLEQDSKTTIFAQDSSIQQINQQLQNTNDDNQRLQSHLSNKDNLIKEQQVIIQELRDQLDCMESEQETQGELVSKLKSRMLESQSQNVKPLSGRRGRGREVETVHDRSMQQNARIIANEQEILADLSCSKIHSEYNMPFNQNQQKRAQSQDRVQSTQATHYYAQTEYQHSTVDINRSRTRSPQRAGSTSESQRPQILTWQQKLAQNQQQEKLFEQQSKIDQLSRDLSKNNNFTQINLPSEYLGDQRQAYQQNQSVDIQNQDSKQHISQQIIPNENLDPFQVLHKSQNFRRQFQSTLDQIDNDEKVVKQIDVKYHEQRQQNVNPNEREEVIPMQMSHIGTELQDDFLKGYNMAVSSSKDILNQNAYQPQFQRPQKSQSRSPKSILKKSSSIEPVRYLETGTGSGVYNIPDQSDFISNDLSGSRIKLERIENAHWNQSDPCRQIAQQESTQSIEESLFVNGQSQMLQPKHVVSATFGEGANSATVSRESFQKQYNDDSVRQLLNPQRGSNNNTGHSSQQINSLQSENINQQSMTDKQFNQEFCDGGEYASSQTDQYRQKLQFLRQINGMNSFK